MQHDPLLFSIFLIFSGSALLATLALFARQAMLVAYIVLGILLGPSALDIGGNAEVIGQIAHVGVIFLLFLLGMNLHPQRLIALFRKAVWVTVASSALFALVGMAVPLAYGLGWGEALVVGTALMFSSTILGLKLLPTTALHHRHSGELIISILLLQDLLAIAMLLLLQGAGGAVGWRMGLPLLGLPLLILFSALCERYLLRPLFTRFDTILEYLFLMTLGWCLGMAQLAALFDLSPEIGAFIGGVALARSPVATFIAESLKPLRDFFLVIFFFAIGAGFDISLAAGVLVPGLLLAGVLLVLKPWVLRHLLWHGGEEEALAREVGVRLGQTSEFSLLIAVVALDAGVIGTAGAYLIQVATLTGFIVSSYWIVFRYPTPIATNDRLRQD